MGAVDLVDEVTAVVSASLNRIGYAHKSLGQFDRAIEVAEAQGRVIIAAYSREPMMPQ